MTMLATSSLIGVPRKMMRSLSRREKMSHPRSPRWVCSITVGMRMLLRGSMSLKGRLRRTRAQRQRAGDGPYRDSGSCGAGASLASVGAGAAGSLAAALASPSGPGSDPGSDPGAGSGAGSRTVTSAC